MKGPQNFAQKIKGHTIITSPYCGNIGNYIYKLEDVGYQNDKVWIYPQTPYSHNLIRRNVILMGFNWEKESYVVKVAKIGDSNNFHTTLNSFDLYYSQFISFEAFNIWMIDKLEVLHKYFYN